MNQADVMNRQTVLVPVVAVQHAEKRRHIPVKPGVWKIPVDLIAGSNQKGHAYLEVHTKSPVLSDGFIADTRRSCRQLREQHPMMAFSPDGGFAGLYQRID